MYARMAELRCFRGVLKRGAEVSRVRLRGIWDAGAMSKAGARLKHCWKLDRSLVDSMREALMWKEK